ncbi:hypothetical protein BV20DRAFT_973795 [Pilatotrama ljubarskyi]|nr:hypothetical protein BV20DRAFT_973795 [Pilatotrama ljubarskyi]
MPADYLAVFGFQHISRASAGWWPVISLPFFIPEQVLRALIEVLPLALREHKHFER